MQKPIQKKMILQNSKSPQILIIRDGGRFPVTKP